MGGDGFAVGSEVSTPFPVAQAAILTLERAVLVEAAVLLFPPTVKVGTTAFGRCRIPDRRKALL